MRINVNPNRMELLKLRRRTAIAKRGHKLLKDKLDELMKRFMALIRESGSAREKVEAKLQEAYTIFSIARAEVTAEEVEEAFAVPSAVLDVEVGEKRIMGVKAPHFEIRFQGGYDCYSLTTTPMAFDAALEHYRELLPMMIELGEKENNIRLLAIEIEKTRRRVNALEYVLIPSLEETVVYISMKLDEMERSYRTQLMKIKSMQSAVS
ncbi:MAG: V-type ATP synthase subunit D [Candidatus Solincola sediminis]|uniref:V-type ATP synthase subunit D n=1 Tax=Candidatus Solincola sediminis TaxID=1797199 RepID=A0A1F2WGI6_9ACTN|nr:MAG: V-type ATP synthase subunit D [Candidatus Solincola sediminis]OFW56254.1 MAG: V-type ATP synthase subunit D [Candidatus Solincola sediminis]